MRKQNAITLALTILVVLTPLLAQGQNEPTPADMYRWDKSLISFYDVVIIASIFASAVAGLTSSFLFGRRYWWATRPIKRIVVAGATVWLVAVFLIVMSNLFVSYDLFPGVSSSYTQNLGNVTFVSDGILNGLINAGVAAGDWTQILTVVALIFLGAALGSLVAILISRLYLNWRGIYARLSN